VCYWENQAAEQVPWPEDAPAGRRGAAWREPDASNPEIRYMPAIIDFLGYNPVPEAKRWFGKGKRRCFYRMRLRGLLA
jgi:hypothetical protein